MYIKSNALSQMSEYRSELMGLAIFNVMLGHFTSWTGLCNIGLVHFWIGLLFTNAFLFLSGYSIYFSLAKNPVYKNFIIRRIKRLYVPFMIMALPFYLIIYLVDLDSITLILNETCLYSILIENNGMWYICASLIMYAIAPVLYKVFKYFASRSAFAIMGGAILLVIIHFCIYDTINSLCPTYMSKTGILYKDLNMFVLGMAMAFLQQKITKKMLMGWILCLVIAELFFYIPFINKDAYLYSTLHSQIRNLSGLLLFCFFFSLKFPFIQPLRYLFSHLGCYSLELYILHLLIHDVLTKLSEYFLYGTTGTTENAIAALSILFSIILCIPAKKYSVYITNKLFN